MLWALCASVPRSSHPLRACLLLMPVPCSLSCLILLCLPVRRDALRCRWGKQPLSTVCKDMDQAGLDLLAVRSLPPSSFSAVHECHSSACLVFHVPASCLCLWAAWPVAARMHAAVDP
jgi:hypothetical protein